MGLPYSGKRKKGKAPDEVSSPAISPITPTPPPSTRETIIPPITKGLADVSGNVDAMSGYAKTLTNCTYQGNSLQLGRPGLELFEYGTNESTAFKAIGNTGTLYNSVDNLLNSPKSFLPLSYVATDTHVYRAVEALSGVISYDIIYTTSVATAKVNDIILFNNELIILSHDGLFKCTDTSTSIFALGSIYDKIVLSDTSSVSYDSNGTGTTISIAWTNLTTKYVKVQQISIVLKKVNITSPGITLGLTVADGTSSWSTYRIDVDTGVSTEYSVVDFIFIDQPELATTFTTTLTIDGISGTQYIYVAKSSGASQQMVQVNGPNAPKGCQLATFNGRLYIGGDTAYAKTYFSNYNNPNDYFTTSSDGLVTYGGYLTVDNNVQAQSYGVFYYKNAIWLTGYLNDEYIISSYDINHSRVTHAYGARLGGNYSVATPYGIFMIGLDNRVMVVTSVNDGEEVVLKDVSSSVAKGIVQDADKITYSSDHDYLYVYNRSSGATTVDVLQLSEMCWIKLQFGATINNISGNRLLGSNGEEYKLSTEFSTVDEKYNASDVPISYEIETHKLRMSRFHRTRLHKVLWDIENDGFSGTLTIASENGNASETYPIQGDPPTPVSTRIKDTGMSFKLSSVTIDELTNVGEIACILSTDGRTNT